MSKTFHIKGDAPKVWRNKVVEDMILAGKGKGNGKKFRHKNERRLKDARRERQEWE
jgi:hypothetical protein